uniref:ShKT domain-containing protein n=1 Tax=Romanomermis culicivorax TaxID=13658 RepID=A0A915IIQ7_ROMCU
MTLSLSVLEDFKPAGGLKAKDQILALKRSSKDGKHSWEAIWASTTLSTTTTTTTTTISTAKAPLETMTQSSTTKPTTKSATTRTRATTTPTTTTTTVMTTTTATTTTPTTSVATSATTKGKTASTTTTDYYSPAIAPTPRPRTVQPPSESLPDPETTTNVGNRKFEGETTAQWETTQLLRKPKAIVMPSSLNFVAVDQPPAVDEQEGCKNYDEDCDYWAFENECEVNPTWMHRFCALACNKC